MVPIISGSAEPIYFRVIKTNPLPDYTVELIFESNVKKIFDVKPYLDTGKFKELKDVSLFNTVHGSFDTIAWDNNLDLDPELLFEKGIEIKEE